MRRSSRSSKAPLEVRLLLDTHVVLIAMAQPKRLRPAARLALSDPAHEIYVSAASVWEIVIKHALGKLRISGNPATAVPAWLTALGLRDLPVSRAHALAVAQLPAIHHDPFDRIMIAQALVEGLTFATRDAVARKYPVATFPA